MVGCRLTWKLIHSFLYSCVFYLGWSDWKTRIANWAASMWLSTSLGLSPPK